MIEKLADCVAELTKAYKEGNFADAFRVHGWHLVVHLGAYVFTRLSDSLDDIQVFGENPAQQKLWDECHEFVTAVDGPQPVQGPLADWILARAIELLLAKLSDGEFIKKQLDALVDLIKTKLL